MSARILRGHTVASHLSTMNRAIRAVEPVPAVLVVTTDVLGETGELRTMHTAVADLGVELSNTVLVEDSDGELESHQ